MSSEDYSYMVTMLESLQETAKETVGSDLQYSARYFAEHVLGDELLEEHIQLHEFDEALRVARRRQKLS